MTQNFKGDTTELQMQAVADPVFDVIGAALDDMYANGFTAAPWLLAMYDDERMPFHERVTRDSFVEFAHLAFPSLPYTGTFEVYLAILKAIFGSNSEIRFYVDDPGKLRIEVDYDSAVPFDFIAREYVDGAYEFFDMVDWDGDQIVFVGVSGIDTEYELQLLVSELVPAGIVPEVSLNFGEISDWVDDDDAEMEMDDGTGIIFVEGA